MPSHIGALLPTGISHTRDISGLGLLPVIMSFSGLSDQVGDHFCSGWDNFKNGSRECKSNNKHVYHIKLTGARSLAGIDQENAGNCSNGGIKYKISA